MSDLHGKNELCQKDFLLKLMPILSIYKSAFHGEDSVEQRYCMTNDENNVDAIDYD